jgi:hypothetical protein
MAEICVTTPEAGLTVGRNWQSRSRRVAGKMHLTNELGTGGARATRSGGEISRANRPGLLQNTKEE